MNATYKPEQLLVIRDGQLDDSYYNAIYAAKRREALALAGTKAVELMTQPIRNFSLNMLDLVKGHTSLVK
jgi:hypothetical protein